MSYAIKTDKKTSDGLTVYDMDPQASELWAVAGPDGIDPVMIDHECLPDGFRWVTADEWESLEDDAVQMPSLEVCSNVEWIKVFSSADLSSIDPADSDKAVEQFQNDVYDRLRDAGFGVSWAKGDRSVCHGWNGFRGWKHSLRVVATFDDLSDDQKDLILSIQDECEKQMRDQWRQIAFRYATDSESGELLAMSFDDAKSRLTEMVDEDCVADGAWGWVENLDGSRYEIGSVTQ